MVPADAPGKKPAAPDAGARESALDTTSDWVTRLVVSGGSPGQIAWDDFVAGWREELRVAVQAGIAVLGVVTIGFVRGGKAYLPVAGVFLAGWLYQATSPLRQALGQRFASATATNAYLAVCVMAAFVGALIPFVLFGSLGFLQGVPVARWLLGAALAWTGGAFGLGVALRPILSGVRLPESQEGSGGEVEAPTLPAAATEIAARTIALSAATGLAVFAAIIPGAVAESTLAILACFPPGAVAAALIAQYALRANVYLLVAAAARDIASRGRGESPRTSSLHDARTTAVKAVWRATFTPRGMVEVGAIMALFAGAQSAGLAGLFAALPLLGWVSGRGLGETRSGRGDLAWTTAATATIGLPAAAAGAAVIAAILRGILGDGGAVITWFMLFVNGISLVAAAAAALAGRGFRPASGAPLRAIGGHVAQLAFWLVLGCFLAKTLPSEPYTAPFHHAMVTGFLAAASGSLLRQHLAAILAVADREPPATLPDDASQLPRLR